MSEQRAFRLSRCRSESPTCPTSPRRRLSRPQTYYWHSVTIGVDSRRQSHIPHTIHVLDSRRCPVRNLHSSRSAVPFAVTIQGSRPFNTRTHEGMGFRCVRHAISVFRLEGVESLRTLGFPMNVQFHRWLLGFRQSRVHHRIQCLRSPLAYPTSAHAAFPTGSVSPWGFPSFRVSGIHSRVILVTSLDSL